MTRVLEMAEEFPLVEFRGLDLGACCSLDVQCMTLICFF
jgi:hypothetical protein